MMPKSTATRRPSSSTNRLPGCMSAWKKPSRSAWRRKLWITLRPSAGRSKPLAASAAWSLSGVPSIHSSVSTSRAVRSQSTAGTRKPASSRVFSRHFGKRGRFQPEIHFHRHRAGERRHRFDRAQALRFERQAFRLARGKEKGVEIDLEAALDAGPQNFHRHRLAHAVDVDFGAVHLRDRGGGDRRPEAGIDRDRAACRRRRRWPLPPRPAGTAPSCPAGFRDRGAIVGADHVRARGHELAELDVSGPQPGERGGEPAGAVLAARPLDQPRQRDRALGRQRQRPRVDQRQHALARDTSRAKRRDTPLAREAR